MNECKNSKYRIQKWLYGTGLVYSPQKYHKSWLAWGWVDMLPDMWDGIFFATRGFCDTEEKAREIIKGDKQYEIDRAERLKAREEAKKNYNGVENICVD
jgi:hypothetical protein